jgi:hypothetical protein
MDFHKAAIRENRWKTTDKQEREPSGVDVLFKYGPSATGCRGAENTSHIRSFGVINFRLCRSFSLNCSSA